ncbi:hypothetical protein HXX76_014136 [Chlamydomonas incerta]|uniref:Uncharacterized protein n=1 Tax=Chlamydomonas incerta TaxID=51695 RepID=A0A835VT77_CHLIN|nr:hypothetical protein HXX76_014136 [Chlamydomonas incerta]|eukprot:KAG2424978.1 hypothetical protein HXX76_014136 [Chlamydomonas incerta]
MVVGVKKDELMGHVTVLVNLDRMRKCKNKHVRDFVNFMDTNVIDDEITDQVWVYSSLDWVDWDDVEDVDKWSFSQLMDSSLILPENDGEELFMWDLITSAESESEIPSLVSKDFSGMKMLLMIHDDGTTRLCQAQP